MSTVPVVGQELQQLESFAKLFHAVFWGAKLNAFRKHPGVTRKPSFAEQWPSAPEVVECLRCLLEDHKNTSLMLAHLCELLLAGGAGDLVVELIQLGAVRPDQVFRYESGVEFSLLHLACVTGAVEVGRYIRQRERNSLWTVLDSEGHTPAQVCYSPRMKQFVPTLRPKKKKMYVVQHGDTFEKIESVHAMVSQPGGFYTFAKHIQCCGLDVNIDKNAKGDCLVHTVVRGGFPSLSYLLFLSTRLNADVNKENAQGMTALCLAAQQDQHSLTEVLICLLGADPNIVNSLCQWTPLHYAAATGCQLALSMLLDRGADPVPEDNAMCSPEYHAVRNRHFDVVEHLRHFCSERADLLSELAKSGVLSTDSLFPSDLSSVNSEGQTLLMVAVAHNRPRLVRQLLQMKGMSKHIKDFKDLQNLQTAVAIASKLNHCQCLELLIRNGCHPAVPDVGQKLPLHYACAHRCAVCISSITSSNEGLTGLKWAHEYLNATSSDPVLGCITDAMRRRQQLIVMPALFQVAERGRWGEEEFLEPGDNINPPNEHGEWPLYVAASHGHLEMVQDLEMRGGRVLFFNEQNANTVLHVAARSGSVETVQFVLDYMQRYSTVAHSIDRMLFDVNARNTAGATPLELAALEGHPGVLELLISSGASASVAASNGGLLCCPHYEGIQHKLEHHRRAHMRKVVNALRRYAKLEDFLQVWQDPYDHNLRTSNGETMLMVAAGDARFEVFHFIIDSLIECPPEMLTKGQQPVALGGYDTDSGLSDEGVLQCGQATYRLQTSMSMSQSQAQMFASATYSPPRDTLVGQSIRVGPAQPPRRSRYLSGLLSSTASLTSSFDGVGNLPVCRNELGKHRVALSGYLRITSLRDGANAAHRAAAQNRHRSLALILDVDHSCKDVQDRKGNTPAHLAAMHYHRYSLEVLQKLAADFNICNFESKHIDELMPQNKSFTQKLATARRAAQPELGLTESTVVDPGLPSHSSTVYWDSMHERLKNLKGT